MPFQKQFRTAVQIKNANCACELENRKQSVKMGASGWGGGRSCLQDTKDSGNIFANKRKLNLRPRMASFGRPTITKSPKRETN